MKLLVVAVILTVVISHVKAVELTEGELLNNQSKWSPLLNKQHTKLHGMFREWDKNSDGILEQVNKYNCIIGITYQIYFWKYVFYIHFVEY